MEELNRGPESDAAIALRSRHTFTKWWREAEQRAGLKHDDRWGWHSRRRKFASELRGPPLRCVCDLGGWKSPATVQTRYQTPDLVSVRRALENRRTGIFTRKSTQFA